MNTFLKFQFRNEKSKISYEWVKFFVGLDLFGSIL